MVRAFPPHPVLASDGRRRCRWVGDDPLLRRYHDREWGRPLRRDAALFERLSLEVFQAGLSWRLVLQKRPALRAAFAGYDPAAVAAFGARDVARLMRDAAIIRNRRKILATITNARGLLAIRAEYGSFRTFLTGVTDLDAAARVRAFKEWLTFMGPETVGCFLIGVGVTGPPHERECWLAAGPASGKQSRRPGTRRT